MKIGELNQHCGECAIAEFCGDAFGFCICNKEVFKDMEEEKYKEIAEKTKTVVYPECVGCCRDECEECEYDVDSRDFFCEQVADNVKSYTKD